MQTLDSLFTIGEPVFQLAILARNRARCNFFLRKKRSSECNILFKGDIGIHSHSNFEKWKVNSTDLNLKTFQWLIEIIKQT